MTVNTSTLKLVGILYKSLACRQKRDGANKYRASWVLPHIMGGAEDEEYNNYDVQSESTQSERYCKVLLYNECSCSFPRSLVGICRQQNKVSKIDMDIGPAGSTYMYCKYR